MKTKITIISLVILLISSLIVNILVITNKPASSDLVKTLTPINTSVTTPKPTEAPELSTDIDYSKDNPIDKFFDTHKTANESTVGMKRYGEFYRDLWKKELNNAYEILINKAHKDLKKNILNSKDALMKYAENESVVAGAVEASDAFGDGLGEYGDTIRYGTLSGLVTIDTAGQIYKSQVVRMLKYFDNLGLRYTFLFDESNISEEDLAIFKK